MNWFDGLADNFADDFHLNKAPTIDIYRNHHCGIDCAWGCIVEDAFLRYAERQFDDD